MNVSTCPITTIDAPIEQVWKLVAEPSSYDLWWEARTVSIVPEGPAQSGQRVLAHVGALGLNATVRLTIQSVQPETHQLDVLTDLPFGITSHNHITCTPLNLQQTQVSFG